MTPEFKNILLLDEVESMERNGNKNLLVYFNIENVEKGCEIFQQLTNTSIESVLNDNDITIDDVVGFCIGFEIIKDTGEIIILTISPTIEEEDCFTDIDVYDVQYNTALLIDYLRTYPTDNPDVKAIQPKLHLG